MNNELQTPFESIEGAQEYLRLLADAVREARQEIDADIRGHRELHARRLQALQMVSYKLEKLEQHMKSSRRILNDLRSLRRLLFEERDQPLAAAVPIGASDPYESEQCW